MLISDAKRYFATAAATGRVGHAYLVVGNPREEAAEFALFAMQTLACDNCDGAPCGHCATCRQIAERKYPDAMWLAPQKKSRIIAIGQMLESHDDGQVKMGPPYFITSLHQTSFSGGWKFGVITFADRMNESAANALLKTLEEPPQRTMLLLLSSDPQMLPATIVSRCETIELASPPPELEDSYRESLLGLLSSISRKGPLAANAYAQQILALLGQMQKDAESEVRSEVKEEEKSGIEVEDEDEKARISALYREKRSLLVLTLQRWFRDLLIAQTGGVDAPIHHSGYASAIAKQSSGLTLAAALANVEAVEALSAQLNERNMPDAVVFPYWMDRFDFGVASR